MSLFLVNINPRFLNRFSISSNNFGSLYNVFPVTSAIASRVKSSSVGPSPPPMIMISLVELFNTDFIISISSAIATCFTVSIPKSFNLDDIHAEFVSIVCPRTISLPSAYISAVGICFPLKMHWAKRFRFRFEYFFNSFNNLSVFYIYVT